MPDQYLGQEYYALQSGVESAAQAWKRLKGYTQTSEISKAYKDPQYFERQGASMYSDRVRSMALQNREAQDMAAYHESSSGLMGGTGQKLRASIASEFAGGVAGVRADTTEWASKKRAENESAFMQLQAMLAESEQGVIGAQQRLAARLGQQATQDKQYKNASWYAPSGPASTEFFNEQGW